jgi:PPK2 family polyphosphate:nucleotide phosphotransferase
MLDRFIVPPGKKIVLSRDYDPTYKDEALDKDSASQKLQEGVEQLAQYQDVLYAQNIYSLLLIFQAMDAAGKDSTIEHVMSGINPQGCQVFSFKQPSAEELDHDYLWRYMKALPERGRIGIFNRSYYEEVLVVRVHPEILQQQQLPTEIKQNKQIWQQRFTDINNFERYLTNNGVVVLKFFLNVSRKEQKERFLDRIDRPEKNWKFDVNDVRERGFWEDYMKAYEDVVNNTSTEYAPWYIIPADRKWFTRLVVSEIISQRLAVLNLQYPQVGEEHRQELLAARKILEAQS